jgi:hypothetical protein
MQQRLKKFSRDSRSLAAVTSRRITETSLSIIATIHDYKIIPTSLLVRVVAGHEKNVQRHLQQLYHKGLVNRFAFMRGRNPGEFHYYLDNTAALHLLVDQGADPEDLEFEEVSRNREKAYCDVNSPKRAEEMQGRLLFLKHEVMISRFHAMLELACSQSNGRVELTFEQGPSLWNKVEVPKLIYRDGRWQQLDESERLPHRPDAFFTLSFPKDKDRDPLHFFYEADRHRTNTNKYNKKLRAHFHFAVKQKKRLKEIYGLDRIRAVLTETIDDEWAERLRQAANHITVSGPKPSPLFWFTTSRLFTEEVQRGQRLIPAHLERPDIVFRRIWASPVDDSLHSLIDH